MINKDGGGQLLVFMGGHRAHGGPPLEKTLPPSAKLLVKCLRVARGEVVKLGITDTLIATTQLPQTPASLM